MSYQVLARKWRPRGFDSLVGQAHVVRSLSNALDADRLHHAFLFTGTRGVGKTTIARILAKCLNCELGVTSTPCHECSACQEIDQGRFFDLLEVDAASRSKVDETRELMDNVQFAPTRGRYKVYLIDEVHMFSDKSFNALLKTLEEPPPHVKFLLATTDPQKIPVTVLSRCLQFNLKRLPSEQIQSYLSRIVEQEDIKSEDDALALIAAAADGSMRDALSLLDQAIAYGAGELVHADTRAMLGSLERDHLFGVLEALAAGDASALMQSLNAISAEITDYYQTLGELLSELQRIAMVQAVGEAHENDAERERLARLAKMITPADVQLFYQIGLHGRRDLPLAPDPRGGFEMALLRMHAFKPAPAASLPAPSTGGGTMLETQSRPAATGEPIVAGKDVAAHPSISSAPVAKGNSPQVSSTTDAAPDGIEELPQVPDQAEPARAHVVASPVGDVSAQWGDLLSSLELPGMLRELAANCALLEWRDGRVRMALSPDHSPLLAVKDKLQSALEKGTGESLNLSIEVSSDDHDTPAKQRVRAEAAERAKAVRAIEQDGDIQSLCDTFETSVDPRSIRPAARDPE